MTQVAFPYHFDARGRTAETPLAQHIEDLIEQILFTQPGERVNRPTFGSGMAQAVFAPNSQELAAATQFLVQGALQQYLSDLIEVSAVQVTAEDEVLQVTIQYVVRRTQQQQVAQFTRSGVTP
jgi:phage baseplate assembly protein W